MFRSTKLTNITFDVGVDMSGVKFVSADLTGSSLINADLSVADLRNATITDTNLNGANLREADLKNVKLKDAIFDRATKFEEANLYGADLTGMHLTTNCKFKNADLEEAILTDGTFEECDFRGAIFREANLVDAEFIDTDLDEVDFWEADLKDTEFEKSDLKDAINMTRAKNRDDADWDDTDCPDGTNSDDHPDDSCYPDHLNPLNPPQ